jgi:hypothetical protein
MQQQLQKQARNIFGAFQFPTFPNPYVPAAAEAEHASEGASGSKDTEIERKS